MTIKLYIQALDKLFKGSNSKRSAHRASVSVLQDMAVDPNVMRAALERYIQDPVNLNTLNFPSLGFTIHRNAYYGLAFNCFFPAQEGTADLTCNAIHHHGPNLLTTVCAFGPGYEHWLFSKPEKLNSDVDLFRMSLTETHHHSKGHDAFVEAHIPHAVFFPPSLSITYALWSSETEVSTLDRLKHASIVQKNFGLISKILNTGGFSKKLGLMDTRYYDYYPVKRHFQGMKQRVQFERGPNQDYLCGLFNVIQETSNECLSSQIHKTLQSNKVNDPETIQRMLKKMQKGEKIERVFTQKIHTDVPHMIFLKKSIRQALDGKP